VGLALAWVDSLGYVPNHVQSPAVVAALLRVYGIAPAACFGLAALSLVGYRLGRAEHRELVRKSRAG
jgi:Na+/melibiose symporter-like transporter